MRPLSIKLPTELAELLDRLARERHLSRSDMVREALRRYAGAPARSITAAAGDLVGSLDGPADLSTSRKRMAGFGK